MIAVRTDIQLAVNRYVELYEQAKEMEKEMKDLRAVIEPFMTAQGIDAILTPNGAKVEISQSQRPVMNAKFTTYDFSKISPLLSTSVLKKVSVKVLDKDRMEALHKLEEIPVEIMQMKDLNLIQSFSVKKK